MAPGSRPARSRGCSGPTTALPRTSRSRSPSPAAPPSAPSCRAACCCATPPTSTSTCGQPDDPYVIDYDAATCEFTLREPAAGTILADGDDAPGDAREGLVDVIGLPRAPRSMTSRRARAPRPTPWQTPAPRSSSSPPTAAASSGARAGSAASAPCSPVVARTPRCPAPRLPRSCGQRSPSRAATPSSTFRAAPTSTASRPSARGRPLRPRASAMARASRHPLPRSSWRLPMTPTPWPTCASLRP